MELWALKSGYIKAKNSINMAVLGPKKLKYKKRFKGRSKGVSTRGTEISFGSPYGEIL